MRSQKIGGPIATILLSTVAALLLLVGAVYAFWQWFSRSGELGDKEKYSAIQIADAEHKGKFNGEFLVLRNVGYSHMKLLGVPEAAPSNSIVWVVLNQLGYDGRVIMVPVGALLRSDCAQLADLLKREEPLPDIAARLRQEMKCNSQVR
jgi:hypothetical protein